LIEAHDFVALMIEHDVLRFGEFTLKSGRQSPYFFNLGAIDDGVGLKVLGDAYADALVRHDLVPDVLFGPAYKGIPIATSTAVALKAHHGTNVGVAFNRKETKRHGEGGSLIGHALGGRVVVVDDVMSAGTAVREAAELVGAAGAELGGALVALDRREPSLPGGVKTAVEEVSEQYAVPVRAIVTLEDVTAYLDASPVHADALKAIHAYQSDNCIISR
jgi:orotate phosphoribosyltransferase